MIKCSCGETNKEGAQFCNRCGKRLPGEKDSTTCSACGHENPRYSEYCGVCGHDLKSRSPAPESKAYTEATDDSESWTKTYGIPGLYESSISEGPGGAEVQTRFSLFGFREVSTYPRWMITLTIWMFLGALILLGLVVIAAALKADRMDLVASGFGILGAALLFGLFIYRVYYKPPRKR